MTRAEASCRICNDLGLHLRAAAALVKLAERFECDISLERDGQAANAKSIIALVTLAATKGTDVRVAAQGPDAQAAVEALSTLIANRFGEPS